VIDNIISKEYLKPEEIAKEFNLDLGRNIILFTQHPVTTESELAYSQVKESLEALKELNLQTIITYPCNDYGSEFIIKAIKEYADNPSFRITKSLGWKKYLGILEISSVVAGNSSSGLIETPIFKVPCVNIGNRQNGRLRAENVIDVPYDKVAIKQAISKALTDPVFLKQVKNCSNPYGTGGAAKSIIRELRDQCLNKRLLQKKMTF
jgi:GDP/UDP-N,N'-diacetylbacillosamine 2-epimerase (hydrolysing)